MARYGPFDDHQTIGFYAGVNSAGTVITICDSCEVMGNDATPDVMAYGWVTCNVIDDEHSTIAAPEPQPALQPQRCCTEDRRCHRARTLAALSWHARDSGQSCRWERVRRLSNTHLHRVGAQPTSTTRSPTRPETWED